MPFALLNYSLLLAGDQVRPPILVNIWLNLWWFYSHRTQQLKVVQQFQLASMMLLGTVSSRPLSAVVRISLSLHFDLVGDCRIARRHNGNSAPPPPSIHGLTRVIGYCVNCVVTMDQHLSGYQLYFMH